MDTHGGGNPTVRMLGVPKWRDVANNYPSVTAKSLRNLASWDSGPKEGALILWHGEPGTGKTHALRALAWEWREWCDFQFVVDPDQFFSKPSYMLEALLHTNGSQRKRRDRWTVLVLEDTGELISLDARTALGQDLSRFLNLTDGVLGQGLKFLVLVTTNEPLSSLHPAVSRPGRCAAIIEFPPFSKSEATEWLSHRGFVGAPRSMKLADLFAASRREADLVSPAKAMGFGAIQS